MTGLTSMIAVAFTALEILDDKPRAIDRVTRKRCRRSEESDPRGASPSKFISPVELAKLGRIEASRHRGRKALALNAA
jgi:hypothetical protein